MYAVQSPSKLLSPNTIKKSVRISLFYYAAMSKLKIKVAKETIVLVVTVLPPDHEMR